MLPLDREKAVMHMVGVQWRITFHKCDDLGNAYFVQDIWAENEAQAIVKGSVLLMENHRKDHDDYHLHRPVVRIERTQHDHLSR